MSGRKLAKIAGSPRQYTAKIDYLRGVDMTSDPINVAQGRAFCGTNMIRSVPGKVRKRMGYERWLYYKNRRINGIYQYGDTVLVHAGRRIYKVGESDPIAFYMADEKSQAFLMHYDASASAHDDERDVLVILDGYKIRIYFEGDPIVTNVIGNDTEKVSAGIHTAENMAHVPQITVGRAPDGEGGDSLEQVNLLTGRFCDSFLGTADATEYQLSYAPINSQGEVRAFVWSESRLKWVEKTDNISINYETGTITFDTAPGAPSTSEDNVRIYAEYDHEGYVDRINHCRFGIVYGVGEAWDRLFVSGNPDLPDCDWYCNSANPFMWGDWNYGEIGKAQSPITGYTVVSGYLATHKANDDTERNCYLRKGELTYESNEGDEPVDLQTVKFPVTDIIQGTGAIAPGSFAFMTEPMYLTPDGIYATTPYEYNSMLYAQRRSRLLDKALAQEENKEEAVAIAFNDFYMLALNGKVYILDTLQRDSSDVTRGSMYQYEGYYWENIPVRVWFVMDGQLYFGTENGEVMRFFSNPEISTSYSDNGAAILARWDMMHTGVNIHNDKTMRWFAVNLLGTGMSGLTLYYKKSEEDEYQTQEFRPAFNTFVYSLLKYSKLFYGHNDRPRTVGRKIKLKKYDSCTLSLRNEENYQGVNIYAIVMEFAEGLHYKI